MICLKKAYRDELLQFALILSLLRANNEPFLEDDIYSSISNFDLDNGTSWRSFSSSAIRSHYVNPKSMDSVLLNYERDLFADLNSLGRYNRQNYRYNNFTTYLLNIERTAAAPVLTENPAQSIESPQENLLQENVIPLSTSNQDEPASADVGLELTQEDMDLIEVLWKQDVDLGFSLDIAKAEKNEQNEADHSQPVLSGETSSDDIEKLKTLKEINEENNKNQEESSGLDLGDPWAGLNYTIDTETGEYVIKSELEDTLPASECCNEDGGCELPLDDLSLPLPEFLLDEALSELDADIPQDAVNVREVENGAASPPQSLLDVPTLSATPTESGEKTPPKTLPDASDLDLLDEMIQTSHFNHPHHRAFQSRMPYMRTVSMEQRWQDLTSLLSLQNSNADSMGAGAMTSHHHHPFSHHHAHALHNYPHHAHHMGYGPDARGVLLHNATLTPPMGDLNGTMPYGNVAGTNIGNAVATSMNLTNSSEPMGEHSAVPQYKLESPHDVMYYQNGSSELNQTDGFLSSILNDEDLQLMDMAMNEGMYTMRMLDQNNGLNVSMGGSNGTGSAGVGSTTSGRADVERMDTSSDSAVSSMGSERVPSLSDGEWCDAGSDSGHNAADHYVTDYHSKYRPFDYSYTNRQGTGALSSPEVRIPQVAQKKHHMFGKRYLQEQGNSVTHSGHGPVKYEYRDSSSASYSGPSQTEGAVGPKPGAEMKYSCSLEFGRGGHAVPRNPVELVQHNHTYHLPIAGAPENTGAMQRPVTRDKSVSKGGRRSDHDEHLTRDEKRARALNVPITVNDIINLPMDEFNERLSKYDLSETQLSLIRDIRRRGKNKVAAQNCRKRKLDQILSLADEVREMRDRKMKLLAEHEYTSAERERLKDKYQQLYRHVFQNLRDADGNQYSPFQYSLQTSADGSILIVPRSSSTTNDHKETSPQGHKE